MPSIREILDNFKDCCDSYGWETSKKEDWIKAYDVYHLFVWTKNIHPSSFNRIAKNQKFIIRENELSYNVIKASYTAWLLFQKPPETVITSVLENPDFRNSIALYNLDKIIYGNKQGQKINYTESPVFRKFENFLEEETEVTLKPIPKEVLSEENTISNIV